MRQTIYSSIKQEMGRFVWWQAAQLLWLLTKGGSENKGNAAVPWRSLESPGAKHAGNLPDAPPSLLFLNSPGSCGLNCHGVFVSKSLPVFGPHRGLFVHSERVFDVSRLVWGANPLMCVCSHLAPTKRLQTHTHTHDKTDNTPESVRKAGV